MLGVVGANNFSLVFIRKRRDWFSLWGRETQSLRWGFGDRRIGDFNDWDGNVTITREKYSIVKIKRWPRGTWTSLIKLPRLWLLCFLREWHVYQYKGIVGQPDDTNSGDCWNYRQSVFGFTEMLNLGFCFGRLVSFFYSPKIQTEECYYLPFHSSLYFSTELSSFLGYLRFPREVTILTKILKT